MGPLHHRTIGWTALVALACFAALGCNLTPDGGNTGDDDDSAEAEGASIYDLHAGVYEEGAFLTFVDKIVTTPRGESGFYIQEPEGGQYSGLYVYTFDEALCDCDVEPGNVVTVSGSYSEWHYESDADGEMTEITLTTSTEFEVTARTDVPEPELITIDDLAYANAEPWEGVLVEVQTPLSVTAGVDSYGQWEVDGVLVDSFFYDADPEVGATVNHLVGVIDYSFWSYHILPRDSEDVLFGEVGPAEIVTIPEIQQGDVESGRIQLVEVVVSSPLSEGYDDCGRIGFFVQDPAGGEYSGIYVEFLVDDIPGMTATVGDVVTLTGSYTESFDLSLISLASADDFEVVSTGGAGPDPLVVADICSLDEQGLEPYEGVLIQVQDVTVTSENPDDTDFGEFEVAGCLRVDDLFMNTSCGGATTTPEPPLDQTMTSVTGLLYYAYSNFKLEPRWAEDFEGWAP
jgi:hypothetical protein